jgi:hypothetical protein
MCHCYCPQTAFILALSVHSRADIPEKQASAAMSVLTSFSSQNAKYPLEWSIYGLLVARLTGLKRANGQSEIRYLIMVIGD